MNDLLYDFEEYVEAHKFNAEKFLELQACSRKAAPGISHRITRLKLFSPVDEGPNIPSSRASPFGPTVVVRQPSDEVRPQHEQSPPYPDDTDAVRLVKYSMPWPPGQESTDSQILPPVREEEPAPRPVSLLDPWFQRFQDLEQGLELIAQRREHASSSDSAIGSEVDSQQTYSPSLTIVPPPSLPAVPPKSPYRILTHPTRGPTFEQTVNFIRYHHGRESVSPLSPQHNREFLASSENMSLQSSISDHRSCERDSYFDAVSPMTPTHRTSDSSLGSQSQEVHQEQSNSPHVRPLFAQTNSSASTARVTEGLEPVLLPASVTIPDGLMLVEEDANQPVLPAATLEMQLGGCGIRFNSSYYQLGGFCKGAMEIMQGGLGIKRIKKQVSTCFSSRYPMVMLICVRRALP